MKTVAAKEARQRFSDLLDRAENGEATVIIRNSRPAGAIVSSHLAAVAPIVDAVLTELGESLAMSEDEDVLEAFTRAERELSLEQITWYEV